MDCNKEEASRAKTLAEEKMQKRDFVAAQKLLMKAQSLFSGLESLPQMLAVCDVHSAAEKKINGLENWYGILQVMHFDDDATIKKQVRKLALLLHPDKNQFPGAEAAFKLVWEASVLLADKEKRSSYDIKRRINSRIASLLNENSGQQCSAANNASDSMISNVTFWTCCEHCGYRYKYLRSHVNTLMNCSLCQKSYMAYDTGLNGVPPKSKTGQKEVRNQGPCNTSVNKSGESTGAQSESVAAEGDKKGIVKEKFKKQSRGGKKKNAEVRKPEKREENIKNTAELHKPQPEVTEPEKGASKSVPDDSVSRNDQASSMCNDKNKRRKFVEEPIEIINVDGSDIVGKADVKLDKKGTVKEKFNKQSGGGKKKNAEVRKPKVEDGSVKSNAESSKPEKGEEKIKNTAELHKPQPEVTEPEKCASKSVPDDLVSRKDQASSMSKDKNKRRKFVEDIVEDKADVKDNNKRRTQKTSYAGKGSSDDSLSPPIKTPRSSVRLKSEGSTKKVFLGVGSSKRHDSGGSSTPSCVFKGKAKKNVDSGHQEISSTKDKESEGCEASGEGVVMAGKINNNHKADEKLIMPDPEFSNFELTASSFAVNQVWSVYDPSDGMPRFYARIEKVLDSEFKLWITWIDPLQDNIDNSIPIACGIFQDGDSNEVDDQLIFSCQMLPLTLNNNIVIYPRKGEIWAIFRGWDISWSASSENHKRPYEYDYVEVLSNFKDEYGLGVAYLGKVEGFVSLFRQHAQYGVLQLQIPPSEMLRFSHKVPSFKMTGKERKGVPPGCFELDTAALPIDLFEVDNAKVDVGLDRERQNGKTGGPFPQASKVEVQANTTIESSPFPKKRQKVNDNHGSFSKASDGKCTNQEVNSVKKSGNSVKAVDDLKPRKSPRLTNKQATSRSGRQAAEKKSANNGESCGQLGGFSSSGEMTTTPDMSENINTMSSLRIRKTPLDIHKPTGNSKKRGRNDDVLLTRSNASIKCSDTETHVPSSCKTGKENTLIFENQRSWDNFQVDQIWAIYSNDKGIPGNYAQIKEIDTSPEFKLHVAPLQLYRPPELITHPVCCGIFKLKTGKAEVLVPSSFSHQVKAVKGKKNRFEVYPGKGEIWALYRNWNTTDCAETEELEIVEVVKTDDQSIQVVPLIAKGFNKSLYERSQESKAGFVDILKTEVHRFSHQIPAFRHEGRATRFGDGECWELDPKTAWGLNLKNP
ncbi:Chaperone protein dnaJ 49 [Cardamine amara subsp. amara]|uniref:Chaperone protein dnaJ 49 n=1 Tax=Cardamine amara subsp. amara TaxID=228776 RepID=A0ABD1B7F8_CARAN